LLLCAACLFWPSSAIWFWDAVAPVPSTSGGWLALRMCSSLYSKYKADAWDGSMNDALKAVLPSCREPS